MLSCSRQDPRNLGGAASIHFYGNWVDQWQSRDTVEPESTLEAYAVSSPRGVGKMDVLPLSPEAMA